MARLSRLVAPGQTHLVWLSALAGVTLFHDDTDIDAFKSAMRNALAAERVRLHAHALCAHEVRVLATPEEPDALSRWVQAIGRRYVRAYNLRHRRNGTLWSGRFRCCCVEPGACTLDAMRWVESAAGPGSAAQRLGSTAHEAWLTDPAPYWALGNTPFERERAYAHLLAEGLGSERAAAIERCLRGGWPFGSAIFADSIGAQTQRPTRPRPRGRPGRAAGEPPRG